jgi:two-component system nitrate/nitrite response regulator NarL
MRQAVPTARCDRLELEWDDAPVERTRVLVADAAGLFRTAVCTLLVHAGFDAEEASDVSGVQEAAQRGAGIVLLDLDLPGGGAFAALPALVDLDPRPSVVVWAADPSGRTVLSALRAGADGFLDKAMPPDAFVSALRGTAAGQAALCTTSTARLVRALQLASEDGRRRDLAYALSPRERDVMQLLTRGNRNYEIARELEIAEPTVKRHVHNILVKTGAPSRRAAIALFDAAGARA